MKEKKLTDEEIVKDIERSTGMPSYWKKTVLDLINRQKAEIERLTEENEYLDMCGKQFFADSQSLQVQVDELKANQVIECHGMLKGCDMVKQAVKDTAKEIFNFTKYNFTNYSFLLMIAGFLKERYGVEVE